MTPLELSIENTLFEMMRKLDLPQPCLTIANVYFNRVIAQMMPKKFFLSSSMAENVAITCLVLAAKFYCETEDVVVNVDIARTLELGYSI